MTENSDTADTPSTSVLDDPEELERFLTAYRPQRVDPEVWGRVSGAARSLVMRAGEPTRLRVEKDIQLLGAVVAHLVDRGRPATLEEALSDTTLLSFDTSLRMSAKSRENKRGIMRRLQAVHRGLPWRAQRRADGARVKTLVPHSEVSTMQRLVDAAESISPKDPNATAFLHAVARVRDLRSGAPDVPALDATTWGRARSFARQHGWRLTHPVLRAVVTHEVLDRSEPVATLVSRYGLTRRDLDLALTRVSGLPDVPSRSDQALLRGGPHLGDD